MTFGVTSTGYTPRQASDFQSDINSALLTSISAELALSSADPLGQIVGIVSRALAVVDEQLLNVYNQFNIDAAQGVGLDSLASLIGLTRLAATFTTVSATVNLNASTTLPAGSKASIAGYPNLLFDLQTTVTSTTMGNYAATFVAEISGPTIVNASTLTVIAVPVSGWNSVTNASGGTTGTNVETDTALRTRMRSTLNIRGACTYNALKQQLLAVAGVQQVNLLENTNPYVDSNSLPPKSFEAVIWDGSSPAASNTTIATTIWNNKPIGIQAGGSTSQSITDSLNVLRTVNFTRATSVRIYINITVTYDPNTFPSNGATQIQNALAAMTQTGGYFQVGRSIYADQLKAAVLAAVKGIIAITTLQFDTISSPTNTATLTITPRQIVQIATGDIVVTTNSGTF